jgi:hypothetical protein
MLMPIPWAMRLLGTSSLAAVCLLAGCALSNAVSSPPKTTVYQNEKFQSDETFSRLFDASMADTCEAARRALLSQGYVITRATDGAVNGSKRFQPDGEVHVEITFNIVCVPDGRDNKISTVFVSAQQDRYAIKKSTNATSIGVSALGSISVPMSSSQDSLVKVAAETIPAGEFYDRFFHLMQRMLQESTTDK